MVFRLVLVCSCAWLLFAVSACNSSRNTKPSVEAYDAGRADTTRSETFWIERKEAFIQEKYGQEKRDASTAETEVGMEKADTNLRLPSLSSIMQIPCKDLKQEWKNFLTLVWGCRSDDDCMMAGASGSCDCVYALSSEQGDALPRKYKSYADAFMQRFLSKSCTSIRVCLADVLVLSSRFAICSKSRQCVHKKDAPFSCE